MVAQAGLDLWAYDFKKQRCQMIQSFSIKSCRPRFLISLQRESSADHRLLHVLRFYLFEALSGFHDQIHAPRRTLPQHSENKTKVRREKDEKWNIVAPFLRKGRGRLPVTAARRERPSADDAYLQVRKVEPSVSHVALAKPALEKLRVSNLAKN